MFSIEVLSCCDFKLTEDAGVFNVKAEKSFCVIQTFTVTPEHCEVHKSKCIYFKDNISTAVTVCSLACCTKGRFLEEKIHPCSLPNRVLSVCLASWPPEGYIFFTHVCLLVGLSSGVQKNNSTDFHETWMEDWCQPRIDLTCFLCGSG